MQDGSPMPGKKSSFLLNPRSFGKIPCWHSQLHTGCAPCRILQGFFCQISQHYPKTAVSCLAQNTAQELPAPLETSLPAAPTGQGWQVTRKQPKVPRFCSQSWVCSFHSIKSCDPAGCGLCSLLPAHPALHPWLQLPVPLSGT